MTNQAYIATSLDGFIARPNGDISWLENVPNANDSDFGYGEFIIELTELYWEEIPMKQF